MAAGTALGLGLWLPEDVYDEYSRASHGERDVDIAMDFRRQLKALDARLDIIWAKPNAKSFPVPGRWYVVRHNEGTAARSWWIVQTPDGQYCAPGIPHLERLQGLDTWGRPDHRRRMKRAEREERDRRLKAAAERHREFREKLTERLRHNHDVQVAITADHKRNLKALA